MDYEQTQLLCTIIEARQRRDQKALTPLLLEYLRVYDDDVFYAPDGYAKFLQEIIGTSKTSTYRMVEDLEDRLHLHKIDNSSLQLNRQFYSNSGKKIKYEGKSMILTKEEIQYWRWLEEKREYLWALRGKSAQPKKQARRETNMQTQQKLIDSLANQLDVKDYQL